MPLCPETCTLRQFSRGTLAAQQFEDIARHVSACAKCEQRLAELESEQDDLVTALKSVPPDFPVRPDEAALQVTDLVIENLSTASTAQVSLDTGRRLAQQLEIGQFRVGDSNFWKKWVSVPSGMCFAHTTRLSTEWSH